jgi:hypothetical protein
MIRMTDGDDFRRQALEPRMRHERVVWIIGFVWLAVIATGLHYWERYDATPGAVRPPLAANTKSEGARWRLTVFVHPHCPCTRATLKQVEELVHAAPNVSVRLMLVRPTGTVSGWERGDLRDAAAEIPDVELICDTDGEMANRFGAETSGQAVLIDPDGRIVFRGGLTRARGREGNAPGHRAILDWVSGQYGAADAPVFGCPLFNPDD